MKDIIIVGGGPAGLTAALYGGRAGLKTLLMRKSFQGGQIVTAAADGAIAIYEAQDYLFRL